MELSEVKKIRRPEERHQAEVSKQTGFTSPATHYQEALIDLNLELVSNRDATFFVRVKGDGLQAQHIFDNDVLIIDRSISAKPNRLALMIKDGEFIVSRIPSQYNGEHLLLWGVITYIIHSSI